MLSQLLKHCLKSHDSLSISRKSADFLSSVQLRCQPKPQQVLPGCRYFLRKLRKVKKANGQVLAVNEVCAMAGLL